MRDDQTATPDSTAVRLALWRAMHVQIDPPPAHLAQRYFAGRRDGLRLPKSEELLVATT